MQCSLCCSADDTPAWTGLGRGVTILPPQPQVPPIVAPCTETSLQGCGEGVGGVLSGLHLFHTTQTRDVAYPDSSHIQKGHLVSVMSRVGCIRENEARNY